ncbi:DpnII family type II restriction endonuclease [Thermotoga sp. SG1]|uniref:DpnII family type II restriction endonuclease n=1 Tax=Thermotoga sp. SG1 TaxID=126739 RepID=UPI000C757266|nr:DpnII family type II restriction endonuclease [Thermotoga sp. SG1]PLV55737.1 hypothetical protein AS006_08885 [Thermotoga sp. SG1]
MTLLSATPKRLFEKDFLLNFQWKSIKTLIGDFIKALEEGKSNFTIHEFDKIFSGLKNTESVHGKDILAKVSFQWYAFTKTIHQSLGSRIGNFVEYIIEKFFKDAGYNPIYRNESLGEILSKTLGIDLESKRKIDFVAKKDTTLYFVELRTSEHTGGKTAQSSLLDKFDQIFDSETKIRCGCLKKGFKKIELIIAILFNEKKELINPDYENYSKGRLTSLLDYIISNDHLLKRVENLINEVGYSANIESRNLKKSMKHKLENLEPVELWRDDFTISFKILLGEQFFKYLFGKMFSEILKERKIADDLWFLYSLALNEIKIAKEFGETNVKKIQQLLESEGKLQTFFEEFSERSKNVKDLEEFEKLLEETRRKMANETMELASRKGMELRLLETNDLQVNYEYLKHICTALLIIKAYTGKGSRNRKTRRSE